VTVNELATAIGTALAPIVVALAPWLHTRLRQLEVVRQPNGERIGGLEEDVNWLRGRVEELSRAVHGGEVTPPPPRARPFRPIGDPPR
jgi:hypothetical protein